MHLVEILKVYLFVQLAELGILWTVAAVLERLGFDMEHCSMSWPQFLKCGREFCCNPVAVGTLHLHPFKFRDSRLKHIGV